MLRTRTRMRMLHAGATLPRKAVGRRALVPAHLALEIGHGLLAAFALQVLLQAAQRNANHIAVMQARTELPAEAQPDIVRTVEILGPETGRVRTEVHIH